MQHCCISGCLQAPDKENSLGAFTFWTAQSWADLVHTDTKYGIRLPGASASMQDSDENATSEGVLVLQKRLCSLLLGWGLNMGFEGIL